MGISRELDSLRLFYVISLYLNYIEWLDGGIFGTTVKKYAYRSAHQARIGEPGPYGGVVLGKDVV